MPRIGSTSSAVALLHRTPDEPLLAESLPVRHEARLECLASRLRRAGLEAALAGLIFNIGCASTDPKPLALTGDLMVDGPNAIAHGPPKDKSLWEYRTAAAAMRQGKFDLA